MSYKIDWETLRAGKAITYDDTYANNSGVSIGGGLICVNAEMRLNTAVRQMSAQLVDPRSYPKHQINCAGVGYRRTGSATYRYPIRVIISADGTIACSAADGVTIDCFGFAASYYRNN